MNRLKNGIIILILISFLCFIAIMPVTCIIKTVTGVYCPACGMTRAFFSLFQFDLLGACYNNILSIPLFIFLCFFIIMITLDFIKNRFSFIPKLLDFFEHNWILIISLLVISMVFNNLKVYLLFS